MNTKTQWVLSASEVAEHVAGFGPRQSQRAYLLAVGNFIKSQQVAVVTSVRVAKNGYSQDVKFVKTVSKDEIVAFLAAQGERMPMRTELRVRPDPALVPSSTTAPSLEAVITDETTLGGV